jgi:hypothetical protein
VAPSSDVVEGAVLDRLFCFITLAPRGGPPELVSAHAEGLRPPWLTVHSTFPPIGHASIARGCDCRVGAAGREEEAAAGPKVHVWQGGPPGVPRVR